MFGFFSKKRPKPLQPENLWVVTVGASAFSVIDPGGTTEAVDRDDLSGVIIETNDSGPGGADVWWLLFGADDTVACAFPQGATGEAAAVDALMALPGFDYEQMIAAMGSANNAVFPVWRRAGATVSDAGTG